MKKRLILYEFIFVLAIAANATAAVNADQPMISAKNQIISQWMDAGDYVAKTTHNAHAKTLIDFANSNRVDVPSVGFPPRSNDVDNKFGIAVSLPGDTFPDGAFGQYLRNAENDYAAASFSPYFRIITLGPDNRDTKISRTFRGIMLLHELNHAWGWFYNNQYDSNRDDEFCREEVRVHSFHNQLMEAIGGNNYKKFIEKEALRIINWQPGMVSRGGQIPELKLDYDVDSFFGRALSDYERGIRNFCVAAAILFKIVELTEKDPARWDSKKEAAMYWKYKSLKMLPSQNL